MTQKNSLKNISKRIDKIKDYILKNKDKLNIKNVNFKNINLKKMNFNNIDFKNIKFKEIYRNDKGVRRILAIFMLVVIVGMGYTGYKVNEIKTRAFDIYIGQDKIGTMRSEEEALKIMDDIQNDLCSEYNLAIVLDNKLSFEDTHSRSSNLQMKMI